MRTLKSYTLRRITEKGRVAIKMPLSAEIVDVSFYPSMYDISINAISEGNSDTTREFVLWGCDVVPENLDGYKHIHTFRTGTSVRYLFESFISGHPIFDDRLA